MISGLIFFLRCKESLSLLTIFHLRSYVAVAVHIDSFWSMSLANFLPANPPQVIFWPQRSTVDFGCAIYLIILFWGHSHFSIPKLRPYELPALHDPRIRPIFDFPFN